MIAQAPNQYMIIGASQAFGENVKRNQFLSSQGELCGQAVARCRLRFSFGLLQMSRSRLRGGLRPPMTMLMHNAPTHKRSLPPILSRAPTRMDAWPQQLLPARTGARILQMAAVDGIYNRNSVKSTCVSSSVVFTYTSLTLL